MSKRLYVGNIPFSLTPDRLKEIFSGAGTVVSANIITDRESGRSKGFAFVEMSTEEEGAKAIASLNGADCDGRPMTVAAAHPAPNRGEGGGGGFRGGGGGGGGPRRFGPRRQ